MKKFKVRDEDKGNHYVWVTKDAMSRTLLPVKNGMVLINVSHRYYNEILGVSYNENRENYDLILTEKGQQMMREETSEAARFFAKYGTN